MMPFAPVARFAISLKGGHLAPIRIGSVARLRLTPLIRFGDPHQPNPPVDGRPRGFARRGPGAVVLLARPRRHDWPETQAAVTIDARDKHAGARLQYLAAHGRGDDVVLLIDRIFSFVHVKLGPAPKRFVGVHPEEIARLTDGDFVLVRVRDPVT